VQGCLSCEGGLVMKKVKGGKYVLVSVSRTTPGGTTFSDHAKHVSTSRDLDASRLVAVHVCDVCGCLFVPTDTPEGGGE